MTTNKLTTNIESPLLYQHQYRITTNIESPQISNIESSLFNKLTKTQNTHTASTKTKFEHQNDINNTLFDYWFFEPLHMPAGVGTAVLKSSVLHQSPGCRLGMSKRQTHIQSQMIIKKNKEDIDCKNELK